MARSTRSSSTSSTRARIHRSHPTPPPPQTLLNKGTVATPEVKLNKVQAGLAACKTPEERIAFVTAHAKEFA